MAATKSQQLFRPGSFAALLDHLGTVRQVAFLKRDIQALCGLVVPCRLMPSVRLGKSNQYRT